MENLREIVLDGLLSMEREGTPSHQLIRGILDKYDYLDEQEKAFIKRLTEGTLERRIELDYDIDRFSSVPVRKMKPLIRNLMRMSVYQLLYMDAVPDSAVCNEACKLAAKRRFQNLKGFVNGVLRKIAREKEHLPLPDPQQDPLLYLSVKYSMPQEIVKDWLEEYDRFGKGAVGETENDRPGKDAAKRTEDDRSGKDSFGMTETILEGLLAIHPVSIRISETVSDREEQEVIARLESAGAILSKSPYLERMYAAEGLENLSSLPDFTEGRFTVQDVSSTLAVKMAGIRPGDLVIDACASPGGKSLLAAELTGPGGSVLAEDVSEKKTEKIRENIERLKADNIKVREWDARNTDPDLIQKADVLLLDVPCSGLGVIGKKRDIKYRVSREGFQTLEELQKEILRGSWQYVKPGGILLYSTCTVRRKENRDMAEWILRELPFEPVAVLDDLPDKIREGVLRERESRGKRGIRKEASIREGTELCEETLSRLEDCCAQLLPGVLQTDGFFFAKFRRKKMEDGIGNGKCH